MRQKHCILLIVVILGAVCSAAQRGDSASADQFELTLEKPKDGPLAGRVSVTGEPTYKATLKTVSFDGAKMTAAYDFPLDDSLEVTLMATFEGDAAKGTWLVRAKAGGEVASGTWEVKKK
jgi:hypothetical protein